MDVAGRLVASELRSKQSRDPGIVHFDPARLIERLQPRRETGQLFQHIGVVNHRFQHAVSRSQSAAGIHDPRPVTYAAVGTVVIGFTLVLDDHDEPGSWHTPRALLDM